MKAKADLPERVRLNEGLGIGLLCGATLVFPSFPEPAGNGEKDGSPQPLPVLFNELKCPLPCCHFDFNGSVKGSDGTAGSCTINIDESSKG